MKQFIKIRRLIGLLFLALPAAVQAQFTYSVNHDGTATITGCAGSGGAVTIPSAIGGHTVNTVGQQAFAYATSLTSLTIGNSTTSPGRTSIGASAFSDGLYLQRVSIGNNVTNVGASAFEDCNLASVTIGKNVTNIGSRAFYDCSGLTTVYFQGNPPTPNNDSSIFASGGYGLPDPATVYYLPGTTGWGSTFGGVPAVLWNPRAVAAGLSGGQFGFNLTGPNNAVIVVEACTDLSHPVWLPVNTNTLSASGASSFNDLQSGNYPGRYYRFRSE